jgi:predicted SAM-dependent methyltransferase
MRLFQKAWPEPAAVRLLLHIGCGQEGIPGWINIDSRRLPGVDCVLDVRQGLPFQEVAAIYAEHFLEHLSLEEGLAFLRECRRALAPDGILRLSTPNLDWVFASHYRFGQQISDDERVVDCFRLIRAFHGWGHQFLYNGSMLSAALRASGFAVVRFRRYGDSDEPLMRGLERHETWVDTEKLPHVLIAEASGRASEPDALPKELIGAFLEAI